MRATPISHSERRESAVAFAACYVYAPQGRGPIAVASRELRARLKHGDPVWLARYAARVADLRARSGRFTGAFGRGVVLVPVPGSRPASRRRVWVAERLAAELVRRGLADSVWTGLRRMRRLRKSATSVHGLRPTVSEHRASLVLASGEPGSRRLVLVDDIVTKGRTLLAAAQSLRDRFPEAEIRAFALVRTLGRVRGLEHLVTPCEGVIRLRRGDAVREP